MNISLLPGTTPMYPKQRNKNTPPIVIDQSDLTGGHLIFEVRMREQNGERDRTS